MFGKRSDIHPAQVPVLPAPVFPPQAPVPHPADAGMPGHIPDLGMPFQGAPQFGPQASAPAAQFGFPPQTGGSQFGPQAGPGFAPAAIGAQLPAQASAQPQPQMKIPGRRSENYYD